MFVFLLLTLYPPFIYNYRCKEQIDARQHQVQIRRAIAELDGMQPLVELLRDTNVELKCLAAETISHCAKNRMFLFLNSFSYGFSYI